MEVAQEPSQEKAKPITYGDVQLALGMLAAQPMRSGSNWREQALCSVVDPGIFDEENGRISDAKKFCSACAVSERCLDAALKAVDDSSVIFAGTTQKERKKIKRNFPRSQWGLYW